jgi:hypothetical protein
MLLTSETILAFFWWEFYIMVTFFDGIPDFAITYSALVWYTYAVYVILLLC